MYFNRKNAEQKNWRMIKKGKHFLFGCSLVFAVGASLATQTVHADTASESTVESGSKAEGAKPGYGGETGTYEAPAAVAETQPATVEKAVVAENTTAKTANKEALTQLVEEVKGLDKAGKTEDSLSRLNTALEQAQNVLANAEASQDQVDTALASLKEAVAQLAAKEEKAATVATEEKAEATEAKAETAVAETEVARPRGKRDLSSRSADRAANRSVDGSLAEGEFTAPGTKQFQSVRYSVDGDKTTWTIAVVPQHKNHQAAGLVVASDDTIQSITVVDRGPNAGRLNEDYYVEKDFGKLPAMSNHKALASHYKYVGGGVPDSLTYRVVTKGTHHNLFARFATAIVKNSLENGGMNGSSAVKNRTSDFPEVGVNISSRLAPQPGVNNTYTQTNDTITVPTVASTDTTISGTGKPGAIINLKSKGQTAKQTQVAANGQWSFPLDFGLNSSVSGGPQLVTGDDISVTQTVNGQESAATPVNISLGHSEIVPSSKSKQQNNLVENDRNVTLKVPHDAGAAYFQFTDKDGKAQEVGLKRDAVPGKWQVNSSSSALASVASSEDGKFYSTINLTLNKDMKAGTTARVISNMQEGSYSSLQGWQSRNVEEAPKEETPAPQPQPQPQPEPSKPITPAVDGATTAPASAPEIVNDLAGKASTPADVTVKAPAGSTVKLYNKDGVVIGEAVANDKGVATVHPTNSLPEGEITATSTPAGGTESAKSAPITVTKTPLTHEDGGVSGDSYTQLMVTAKHITVYPGDPVNVTIQAAGSPSIQKFWIPTKDPNDPYLASGLEYAGDPTVGGFLTTAGSKTFRDRKVYYRGNVAMTQPAGSRTATYAVQNKNGKVVTRTLTITVLETAKKYDPVAGTKVDIANPNNVSEDEKTKIIDSVKTANPSLPAESQYSVDEKGNLTITYPDKSTDKISAAYLVNAVDKTAPDKPVVNTDLTGKAGTKTPVEVTAEKGSTVALYDKDNNKIGEATAGENGKATITPKVDIPAGNVTAKATDAAGNTSDASNPKVATDTTAPAKPVVNTDLTGKAGTKTPVEVTAEKGSTVALYDKNNNKIGEATAGANGKATITPKVDIPAGPVTAKATDAAGNTSVASDPKEATPARVNVAPTVEIPYSDPAPDKKEVYLYTGEEADVDITFNDDSGKIKSAALKQGGNRPLSAVNGNPDKQDNQFGYTVTAINSETATPAKIKVTGQVSGIAAEKLPKTEDDSLDLVTRFATATDTDGKQIENNATKYVPGTKNITESYKTDPGAVTFVLKAQTKKYDIKTPASADKVTVSDANNVTDKEFEKIKEKVKVEYSQNNPDARLADKKGEEVEDASKVVDKVEKEGNKVVVTYKDGSKDTKPLSEFVNVAPKVELPYSNEAKKEIYVYTGENTDLTFKASDNTAVKDMYVRGPGGIGKDNTADYGFTTGKIENSAVTHGDGTVSGATATIKMTGVTTLKAPNHWTSFVVANDNDNAPSNTDFNALDKNPNATQTPGYVHFIVKSQTDKYDIATPAPADKVEVADPTNVTNDDLDKIKEKLKLEYNKKNDDANIAKDTPVDKNGKIQSVKKDDKGNLVVTYTDGSTDTKPLSEFVTKKPTDADKNEPTPKAQTVDKGTEPKAEDSIGNLKDLPKGTTVAFKDPVDTTTPGEKPATAVVTYPDGSKEEVPVKVTVTDPSSKPTDADKNEPTPKAQTVDKGTEPKAEDSIGNLKDLPKGTTVAFKDPVDTTTPGEKPATAVVTYPDGSKEEVPVKVTVTDPSSKPTDADKNEPTPKAQTVDKGTEPKAEDSIGNLKDLPKGTTVAFKDPV
ncbi:Rib/alpha-like domain-containing protein, partial [Streptococcus infantis]|uniref:Rib/alpha-like domain-containing protein n=1 Tax=Streptococcus infantis TaxID=68892 RepID=UPI0039C12CD3